MIDILFEKNPPIHNYNSNVRNSLLRNRITENAFEIKIKKNYTQFNKIVNLYKILNSVEGLFKEILDRYKNKFIVDRNNLLSDIENTEIILNNRLEDNYNIYGIYRTNAGVHYLLTIIQQVTKMAIDFEVFEGKSLSDLFKDIYENTEKNRTQLDVLMKEVVGFIKDGDTAIQIIPMLKEYLEINVKNDEQLVKLATIVQRLAQASASGDSEGEFGLTEKEKEQLMNNIQQTVEELQDHSDNIAAKVN